MATDKCILMFLLLIVGGIVAIVVLKVAKVKLVKDINISVPLPTKKSPPPPMPPPAAPPASSRRMLRGDAHAWGGDAAGAQQGGWGRQGAAWGAQNDAWRGWRAWVHAAQD
jgi:hypothetical protein